MEKCFEGARQDEKHVPHLLEAMIQPPGLVKEELRQKLFKIDQITTSWINILGFCGGPCGCLGRLRRARHNPE